MFREFKSHIMRNEISRTIARKATSVLVLAGLVLVSPQVLEASGTGVIVTYQGNVGPFGQPHARNALLVGNPDEAMNSLPGDIQAQFAQGRKRMEATQVGPIAIRMLSVPGVDLVDVPRGAFVTGAPRRESGNTPTK